MSGFVWEKTYRFRNLRKWKDFNKKQLTLHKMCVTWPLSCVVFFISNVNVRRCLYFDLGLPEEPRVSEVRESFDVCLFFGEQRHKKGGHDRKGDETWGEAGIFPGVGKVFHINPTPSPKSFPSRWNRSWLFSCQYVGSITSRYSGKWARIHPPREDQNPHPGDGGNRA